MSNEKIELLHHKVKGTLQQVDTVFGLIKRLTATDPTEAKELQEELARSLEAIASELRKTL